MPASSSTMSSTKSVITIGRISGHQEYVVIIHGSQKLSDLTYSITPYQWLWRISYGVSVVVKRVTYIKSNNQKYHKENTFLQRLSYNYITTRSTNYEEAYQWLPRVSPP